MLKKRFFPTAIALALFLVLFAYVNLYEVAEIPEPGKDPVVEIAAIPVDQVKTVTWKLSGSSQKAEESSLKVEANPAGGAERFRIASPKALRADVGEIEGILRNFQELNSEGITVQNATDTGVYGIGTDSPVLTIETATQTVSLTLGAVSPVGGMVYLKRQNDANIYMVASVVGSAFQKKLEDLRAKTIFFENFSEISSLRVESASGTFAFKQGGIASWFMKEPQEAEADGGEVSSTIFGARDLRIAKFVNDAPTASDSYGFETPSFKVTMENASGTRFELIGGREEGGQVFVKRTDQPNVYAVAKTGLAFLQKDFTRYRTKELPKLARNEVTKMILKTATDTWELSRASDTWSIRGKTVEKAPIEALIDAYNSERVSVFLPIAQKQAENLHDLNKNDRLELHSGKDSRILAFGRGDGTNMAILLEGREEVMKVSMELYNAFKAASVAVNKAIEPELPKKSVTASAAVVPAPAPGNPQPLVIPAPAGNPVIPTLGASMPVAIPAPAPMNGHGPGDGHDHGPGAAAGS